MNFEPAIAGWMGIALAASVIACAGGILRLMAVCKHHIERMERLQEEEKRLKIREKRMATAAGAKR